MGETPPEVERWRQGLNYHVHEHQVGVMNVFEQDGSPIAQLSVFDPATSSDDVVRVRANDEFAVGTHRYRVIDVVLEQGDERDYLDVEPVRRSLLRRLWRLSR